MIDFITSKQSGLDLEQAFDMSELMCIVIDS